MVSFISVNNSILRGQLQYTDYLIYTNNSVDVNAETLQSSEKGHMWFLFGEVSIFLWMLGMGCVILLWHSLSLPYNYFAWSLAGAIMCSDILKDQLKGMNAD